MIQVYSANSWFRDSFSTWSNVEFRVCNWCSFPSQILSLLPPYKGKDVIELGAGIGRFTGDLAKSAGHVLAMDFMENLIKKVVL